MRLRQEPQPQGWNGRKLRNGLDLAGKATALVLLRLLGKLKTRVFRKREIYNKERFKDRKFLNGLQCVKNICKLKVLKSKKKEERK